MSDELLSTAPGMTPLNKDELGGLVPTYISTQGELNALEQENILRAEAWLARPRKPQAVLTEKFFRQLHREMFGDVWRWAGAYRNTEKTIGIPWMQIPMAVKTMLENAKFQLENKVYDADELAARLHHRAVEIHAFPNGNGRHARYLCDALLHSLGLEPFTWGAKEDLGKASKARSTYIAALKDADKKNFAPLFKFVRS